jgi:DNA primase
MKIDTGEEFSPKVVCPNPDHDTMKSHFQVNLQQPTVHCFAHCGISGSYEHAVCLIEGLYDKFKVEEATNERERKQRRRRAYREARKIILRSSSTGSKFYRTANVQKKRPRNPRAATAISPDTLSYEHFLPPVALEYLASRGITDRSISEWEIGWLPDEKRIVIPALDENSRLRFLIKRAISERQSPKYLYTEGFPKTSLLFGACKIDLGLVKSEGLVLVEGSVDAIALRQEGLKNVGAILGTGISDEQVRILARFNPPRVYLLFDKDTAGIHNIEIAVGKLRKYPLYVVRYPHGKSDPAELGSLVHRQIGRAVPALKFVRENGLSVKTRERIKVG